jgi:hypothetical protein
VKIILSKKKNIEEDEETISRAQLKYKCRQIMHTPTHILCLSTRLKNQNFPFTGLHDD